MKTEHILDMLEAKFDVNDSYNGNFAMYERIDEEQNYPVYHQQHSPGTSREEAIREASKYISNKELDRYFLFNPREKR